MHLKSRKKKLSEQKRVKISLVRTFVGNCNKSNVFRSPSEMATASLLVYEPLILCCVHILLETKGVTSGLVLL